MQLVLEKNNFINKFKKIFSMFMNDKLALISIIFLLFMVFLAFFGPSLISETYTKMNIRLMKIIDHLN